MNGGAEQGARPSGGCALSALVLGWGGRAFLGDAGPRRSAGDSSRSLEPDELPARHVIEDYGTEQMVFSTDYPHGDSKYPRAMDLFLALPLGDSSKKKILWDNAVRLYAL